MSGVSGIGGSGGPSRLPERNDFNDKPVNKNTRNQQSNNSSPTGKTIEERTKELVGKGFIVRSPEDLPSSSRRSSISSQSSEEGADKTGRNTGLVSRVRGAFKRGILKNKDKKETMSSDTPTSKGAEGPTERRPGFGELHVRFSPPWNHDDNDTTDNTLSSAGAAVGHPSGAIPKRRPAIRKNPFDRNRQEPVYSAPRKSSSSSESSLASSVTQESVKGDKKSGKVKNSSGKVGRSPKKENINSMPETEPLSDEETEEVVARLTDMIHSTQNSEERRALVEMRENYTDPSRRTSSSDYEQPINSDSPEGTLVRSIEEGRTSEQILQTLSPQARRILQDAENLRRDIERSQQSGNAERSVIVRMVSGIIRLLRSILRGISQLGRSIGRKLQSLGEGIRRVAPFNRHSQSYDVSAVNNSDLGVQVTNELNRMYGANPNIIPSSLVESWSAGTVGSYTVRRPDIIRREESEGEIVENPYLTADDTYLTRGAGDNNPYTSMTRRNESIYGEIRRGGASRPLPPLPSQNEGPATTPAELSLLLQGLRNCIKDFEALIFQSAFLEETQSSSRERAASDPVNRPNPRLERLSDLVERSSGVARRLDEIDGKIQKHLNRQ